MSRRIWTPDEDQYMYDYYANESQKEIAKVIGRSVSAIQNRGRTLGLSKSEAYMADSDNLSRFKKGHVSHNKGKKISPEQYARCKATMFKPGIIPKNTVPVGTIRERHNYKRDSCYLLIKVAEPGEWEHLHRHVWEAENGPIPKKMNLVFKDGNFRNCQLENLELITNDELMRRNTIHNQYPEEVVRTVQLLGALKRRIKNHEKQN
ncbi:MAG: HNH endonuclease [Bacteroidales bacterium]|nr:HNH endonuclease [Bacteroidales bacterium]